jgi:hypothetical protein
MPLYWAAGVRRFLLEHLVAERNLARNTQRSYRDTLGLACRPILYVFFSPIWKSLVSA